MHKLSAKSMLVLLAVAVVVVVVSACSLASGLGQNLTGKSTDTSQPQTTESAASPDENTSTPAADNQTPDSTNPGDQLPTDQPADQQPVNQPSYLDTLASYSLKFTLKADGTNDLGNPVTQSLDVNQQAINKDKVFFITRTGDEVELETAKRTETIYVAADKTYVINSSMSDQPCALFFTQGNYLDFVSVFLLDNDFPNIERGDLVKQGETINGVLTDHYKVKNLDTYLGSAEKVTADIWVAQDGNYPIKFAGTAEGSFELNGQQTTKSKMTWEYNLMDIDKVKEIKLPQECQQQDQAVSEIPVPPDAKNKDTQPGYMMFNSSQKPEALAQFYRDALAKAGWTKKDEFNDQSNFVIVFQKDKRELQVEISSTDPSTTNVIITDYTTNN